jgi:O-acetylhomoserine/O-acetylserine sulfhydrylase-like pyridoxal-dependent enzyme
MANTTFSGPVRSENGFETITKNGTTGAITVGTSYSNIITGSVHSLAGPGAVNLTDLITEVSTTGADALTLADGSAGQVKIITMVADGGDGTLTPATLAGGTTITFNDVGDGVVLVYGTTAGWVVVGNNGATIA